MQWNYHDIGIKNSEHYMELPVNGEHKIELYELGGMR